MREDDDAFDVVTALLGAVVLGVLVPVVVWLVRRPVRLARLAVAVVVVWLVVTGRAWWLAVAVVTLLVAAVVWWRAWPVGFGHQVTERARGWVRSWRYRRRWARACTAVGLDAPDRDRDGRTVGRVVPARGRVWSTPAVDRFTVTMLPGQTLEDWGTRADALATALDVTDLRFTTLAPGRWWQPRSRRWHLVVTAVRRDVLAAPVEPWPAEPDPDLGGLPVAVREDGTRWRLPLLGNHVLVGGATGAGKGSALWSVVHHLAPAVAAGTVRLYGIDPKAVELAYAPGVFHTVTDGDPARLAQVLEGLVTVMDTRKTSMRGRSRLHVPTVAEPMIVVVVDELAALTAYAPATEKKRITAALGLLLTQGRALGISVLAAAQDPRKETLPLRGLFTVRVGMRLSEPEDTDMLLGQGARARGAVCDRIPAATPGVAWVMADGDPTGVRVRFPWMSDQHVRAMSTAPVTVVPSQDDEPGLRVVPDVPMDGEAA